MDFIQFYHKVRARWKVVACSIAVCVVLAVIYLLLAHRVYSSFVVFQVQESGGNILGTPTSDANAAMPPEVLNTVEQSLTSQSLMLQMIHVGHLGTDPKFARPKKDGTPYLDSELLEILKSKMTVELVKGTRLFQVTIEDRDPFYAQTLVQLLISQYLEQSFQAQINSLRASNDYLSDEVQRFWPDLPRIREALAKKDPSGLLAISTISQDPEVAGLQTRIHEEEAYFASVKEVFMENHPRYIAAQRRLQELQEAQQAALLRAAERVQTSYDNAKATQTELTGRLEQQALPSGQTDLSSETAVAERVESDRALYDSVLGRMNQIPATQRVNENTVEIVEKPLVADKPVRPRPALTLAAAIFGGLVLGVGLVLGRDFFDNTFSNVVDVEVSLGAPILAMVPKSKLIAEQNDAVTLNSNSIEAEAFRTLRTSIHLIESKGETGAEAKETVRNAVLFTSANAGEGKTSCAYNYAVMLARQGLQTLLIDADLRRATLTALIVKSKKGAGLAEVLSGAGSLEDLSRPTMHANLVFLPAGGSHGGAEGVEELLHMGKVGTFLRKAGGQFDRIVIDTPPIHAVSDSLLFAPHVLMNCLVIRVGTTPKTAVTRACLLLKEANRGLIGVVLNNVGTDVGSAYAFHGYAKDYSYSYGEIKP
jgi:succinoglycan biosynthesis transport protein ExoP